MNIMFRPEPGSEVRIPAHIEAALRTVRPSEMNHANSELCRFFVAQNVPLGECPEIIRKIVAYARRIERAGGPDAEAKTEELRKLAAALCESGFGHRTRFYGPHSFQIMQGWKLYYVLL